MTGKEYTFKQVGHAMAVIGYIYKWYIKWHSLFPFLLDGQEAWAFSRKKIHECDACKYYYSIVDK